MSKPDLWTALAAQDIEERAGRQGMGSHQSAAMLKDAWLTPPDEIHRPLGGSEEFDMDPCAPLDRPWDTAKQHYTIVDNGLLKPWHGRVWLNPPYGGPETVGPWMRRMIKHGTGTALIFARTETELAFETIWRSPSGEVPLQMLAHHPC